MEQFNILEEAEEMLKLVSSFSTCATLEIGFADEDCHTDFDIAITALCTVLNHTMVEICEVAKMRQILLEDNNE